jgi:PqqD family protein of HPr-rel-A system
LRPAEFDRDDQWWVPRADALAWRTWDDEIVLYDDRSDETHHFDAATAAVFETLVAKPASMHELTTMLADRLQVRVDGELASMVREIVLILHAKHIISVTSTRPDAPGSQ